MRGTIGSAEKHFDPRHIADRLSYDQSSGIIKWKNGLNAGKEAGHLDRKGYTTIRIGNGTGRGILLLAHRVAWCITYGRWPDGQIDHINRNRSDNRIENLREADPTLQARNTSSEGVCFCAQTGTWKAYLSIGAKQIWLGRHKTKELAIAARKKGEQQYWRGDERVA